MKQVNIGPGAVLRVKKLTAVVDQNKVAVLNGPPGRQLVVLVLGVSDTGMPFDVEPMLRALGYVPEKKLDALIDHLANIPEPEKEQVDDHNS